jgi:hypothetical protein
VTARRRIWLAGLAAAACLAAVEPRAQTGASPRGNGGGEDLTRRLDKSNGVIAPRSDVDPAMQLPPPPVNAPTVVVPPPTSRSGEKVTPN